MTSKGFTVKKDNHANEVEDLLSPDCNYVILYRLLQNDLQDGLKSIQEKLDDKFDNEIKHLISEKAQNKIEKLTSKMHLQNDIPTSERMKKWEENKKFFFANREKYKNTYPRKCIAVNDGKIVYIGNSVGEVADWIYSNKGYIPFYADFAEEHDIEVLNFPIMEL